MTKKDYIIIAEVIKGAMPHDSTSLVFEVAEGLCVAFECDNPRFDRARFLTACGASDDQLSVAL